MKHVDRALVVKDAEARASVRRLLRVLNEIAFAMEAAPAGGSIIMRSRGAPRETTLQEAARVSNGGRPNPPDPARERYRRLMDRTRKQIDRLATRAHDDLVGAPRNKEQAR